MAGFPCTPNYRKSGSSENQSNQLLVVQRASVEWRATTETGSHNFFSDVDNNDYPATTSERAMDIETSTDPVAFSEFENSGWDEISSAYELLFGPLTDQSTSVVMESARVRSGTRFLDVCTGPGMLAHEAAKIGAVVSGLDFSEEALTIAQRNVPDASFHQGDAQDLPFEENSFDSVVCGFGIIHVPDPKKALQEMYCVLKPGGQVAVSVWEAPNPENGFGLVYGSIRIHGDLSVPLPHGPDFFQFSDKTKFSDALRLSGFRETSIKTAKQFWDFCEPTELIRCITDSTVRARGLLSAQTEANRQNIVEAIITGIDKFRSDDGKYRVPMHALVGSGTK